MSTSSIALSGVSTVGQERADSMTRRPGIPFGRLVALEQRKMFDTRSGFWLLMSIGILSLAATVAVILFAPDSAMNYESFASAVGVPMSILLPLLAVLAITGEWSQRSGLTTFTLVPVRGRVLLAKLVATVIVGVVSMLVAAGVGAIGNIVGSAVAGVDLTWGIGVAELGRIVLANVLGMLMGSMLGLLLRSSAAGLVGYFAYAFVLPTISGVLAQTQDWYRDVQHWVDFQYDTTGLYDGTMTGADWTHLGVTGLIWLVLPLAVAWRIATRAEVK